MHIPKAGNQKVPTAVYYVARNRTCRKLDARNNSNNFIVFDKYGLIVTLTRDWIDRGDVVNHQIVTRKVCKRVLGGGCSDNKKNKAYNSHRVQAQKPK